VRSRPDIDQSQFHARARERGVNPIVYWIARAILQPFAHLYWRLSRIGREHIPSSGPVIIAANHRSFIDPFMIGLMCRRPVYYVAKEEIFRNPIVAWLLNSLGAFPVRRGAADTDMVATAKAILLRGDPVVIFPEGTRTRPGALGKPKRGVGRLALETGAPVVPIAMIGTESIRRGWRIRPYKIRVRAGSPLQFPHVEEASSQLAAAVTDRIWPNVMLQWEWLGGLPPVRRAAVIGAGAWGTAVAVKLARAGIDVELGCRTRAQADLMAASRFNEHYLPGVELPARVRPVHAPDLELSRHDLVAFAVTAADLPAAVAAHGPEIPPRTGVLVLSKGLVGPLGSLPSAFVAERTRAWGVGVLGGPAHAAEILGDRASLVLAAENRAFARQVSDALSASGLRITHTRDVLGVDLAGCAKHAAVLAAACASAAGANAAGAAAGKVFAEIDAYARRSGSLPGTFAGLAGTGDLVAAVLADDSADQRAGELLARGMAPDEIAATLGQGAAAVAAVPLLAARLQAAGIDAPVLRGLAGIIEGSVDPSRWTDSLTAPQAEKAKAA
jgi:glycerol-3-phosphate dehydrogenase (NAD(P)+)